ncbi:hypothetical protein GLOIN_2v1776868 [Rhizophagus irregularis DAOM 181602=DAOM 197198]|nr:hypothetical protein GLOIN_2v1776868 [Rhizophagus irregularis DAOM 181602=DAOM 197198]
MMKWTHFLKENGLALRIEPKWFKIVRDRITINGILERELCNEMLIKRMELDDTKKVRNSEDHSDKSRKETNKEIITWKDPKSSNNIYSIRSKKSRHRFYDEIGKHMIEYDQLQANNDVINSPFLINCKGCNYNIRKKKDWKSECYIYIEKDLATTIPGRWEKDNVDVKYIKPYRSLEYIDKRNASVQNMSNSNKEKLIINDMIIDRDKNELRANAKFWLNSVIEETGIYENLNNFIERDFFDFTDKEIFLQIGAIIQKGPDLNLDGFFGIEIFAKNSKEEKFSIEGKVSNTRNERKIYAIGIIIALMIIPDNVIVDLRTDEKILKWFIDYSKIGSNRRELDDPCYIFLNCINIVLELKNIRLLIDEEKDNDVTIMKSVSVKLPALKQELIRCKDSIKEVVLKYSNIAVDEYALRWNYNVIEGAYRKCFKEISNNINRIDLILMDYVKDCFVECNGANVMIDWKETFKLINNEISTGRNVTNRLDASRRSFRVKNFLKILPTYEILYERKVWGIESTKCPRCIIEVETWEHIWSCGNNGVFTEYKLFSDSIEEICVHAMTDEDSNEINKFKENLVDISTGRSMIMPLHNMIREITRGIINEKWMNVCKNKNFKTILRDIFDLYLTKIQEHIWKERCNEVTEIEKQKGLFKDLKRKRRDAEDDSEDKETDNTKLENSKNRKKIKKIIKIDLENKIKNDVFSYSLVHR